MPVMSVQFVPPFNDLKSLPRVPFGAVVTYTTLALVGETVMLNAGLAPSIDTPFFDRFRPTLEPDKRLAIEDAVRALLYVLTSPPNVLHGEIVIRPRVI